MKVALEDATHKYGAEYRTLKRLASDLRGLGYEAKYRKEVGVSTSWGTYRMFVVSIGGQQFMELVLLANGVQWWL